MKKYWQKDRLSWMQPKLSGNCVQYLSVLNWASDFDPIVFGGEDPVHCAGGTQVASLVEQAGIDFQMGHILEALVVQFVDHGLSSGWAQSQERSRPFSDRLGVDIDVAVKAIPREPHCFTGRFFADIGAQGSGGLHQLLPWLLSGF